MKRKNIETLPATNNPLFAERELEKTHTNFAIELTIFENIKRGNVEAVKAGFNDYVNLGFVMGNMANDELRQFRYWAISGIAVATHYAILGGADETDVFNLSDECIRFIDQATSEEEILAHLSEKVENLTYMVYLSKLNVSMHPAIRQCIHYIHVHLHQKITLDELASVSYLSKEYLSTLFKSEVGTTIHKYILHEKLNASLIDLRSGESISEVAYNYGFCSETHYIKCFRDEFGCTPKKYF